MKKQVNKATDHSQSTSRGVGFHKYSILLLLALMFAAPGVTAYLFYQHPGWLGSSTINKGTLLNPPVPVDFITAQSKWRIIFWSPKSCNAVCLKELDTLARMRLALGRKLYEVDQWLVLGDKARTLTAEKKIQLKAHDFHVIQLASAQQTAFPASARVFIVNPDNYLILGYQIPVKPDEVYKDLKLLINAHFQARPRQD